MNDMLAKNIFALIEGGATVGKNGDLYEATARGQTYRLTSVGLGAEGAGAQVLDMIGQRAVVVQPIAPEA